MTLKAHRQIPVTTDEVTKFVVAYTAGKSIREISDETGRGYGTVRRYLLIENIQLRSQLGHRKRRRHRA